MTVTHQQALEIARQGLEPTWDFGTFCVDDRQIVDNDILFVIALQNAFDDSIRIRPNPDSTLPVDLG